MGIWPQSHLFQAKIKNVGRTPARIEGIAIRYIRGTVLPENMNPKPDLGEIDTETIFLLPDTEIQATATLEPERGVLTKAQIELIRNEREFLFAYGVVRYGDVYGRAHETRFGYAYRAPIPAML